MTTTKIIDFVPSQYKIAEVNPNTGKKNFLPALYKAIDNESQNFEDLTVEAFKQLFLVTATGKYLIRLGAQEGFTIPQQTGLNTDAFRSIVPAVVSYPKQVSETIIRLMSIFFGKSLVSPSFTSTVSEPYSFQDQDVLLIRTDKGDLSVGIYDNQVADITNVKASEYAGIINSSQSDVFADTYYDRETSKTYVRLTSKTTGSGAFIQIVGGTAQNVLKFSTTISTLNATGTTWNITKKNSVLWTDITTFTWDGIGVDPEVFKVGLGDYVTFRGLTDPALTSFNGTFVVEDVGFDYFTIRNERFTSVSATLIEPTDNTIVFTKDQKSTIIQNKEYCLCTESSEIEYSLFVSTVPSIVKRNLVGGGFIHGWQSPVLAWDRTSITLKKSAMESIPVGVNSFVLESERFRADYKKPYYKTFSLSETTNTVIYAVIDDITAGTSVLPYTVPTILLKTDPLYGEIQSSEIVLDFGFNHGLFHAVGFTLAGVTGFLAGTLNQEQYCKKRLSDEKIAFELNYGKTVFAGIDWNGSPDVYQALPNTQDYDFYLLYPDTISKSAAGFEDGMTFSISFDPSIFVSGKEGIGGALISKKCAVVFQDDLRVYFRSGIGTGSNGIVLTGVYGKRSGWFGGSAVSYFVDQSTDNNLRIFNELICTFQEVSPSINTEYVGPYVYDTEGIYTRFVVGNILTSLRNHVLKGDNLLAISVLDSSAFPMSGSIVFDYGTDSQEGPIDYINIATNQIILDPSYVFQKEHIIGAQVQIVRSKVAPIVHIDGREHQFFITGTSAARDFFFELVRQIVAAGVFVNAEVNYPALKYTDSSLFPYE